MNITKDIFGKIEDQIIHSYTLENKNGMKVSVMNYGCIINKIIVPDKFGNFENVVLGYDTIEEYLDHNLFYGCIVGRVGGRIQEGAFELEGTTYHLEKNDGNNHIHGGPKGYDKVIWNTLIDENEESANLIFTYLSKDGEEGYPGNIELKVIYSLNNLNELSIRYEGITDKTTLLDLTNHTYFNLSGDLKRDILKHHLTMKSNQFLELDSDNIPTGTLLPVENTVFDFNNGRVMESGITSNHEQIISVGKGYDHPFVLDKSNKEDIKLYDEESGRILYVETDRPAVILYSGNFITDDHTIRGVQSRKHLGLCLETQGFPDAIHHNHFPSPILEKDELYCTTTTFKFSI